MKATCPNIDTAVTSASPGDALGLLDAAQIYRRSKTVPNGLRMTKAERSRQVNKAKLCRPYAFYATVVTCLNVAVAMNGTPTFTTIAAHLFLGLLSWGLFEYAVHRWVLHRSPRRRGFNLPGNLTHLRHHANPRSMERLSVQLSEGIPVCVSYCLLTWAITQSWQSMTYLFTGLIAGYLFYEYLDYQAHHGNSRVRLIRYFRKYHSQHHHYDATVRFGVTSPLFDYLFGTFHIDKGRNPTGGRSNRQGV